MSRVAILALAVVGLALPVGAGLYALSSSDIDRVVGLDSAEIDEQIVEQALSVEAPPLDLNPAPALEAQSSETASIDLESLAAADPEGARALVRQVLLADPFILEESIEALETVRAAQETNQVAQVIADNAQALFSTDGASVMGNPEGTITLVEFLDYNCGFCKRAHSDVLRLIEENPDLRVLVKDFPVLGPGSLEAAQVAIAYRRIGGDMEPFIHAMMTEDSRGADATLARDVALSQGADAVALDLALDNPELMAPIAITYSLAEQLNIGGTPAFIIGQERLLGAVGFDRLQEALQVERERLSAL